LSDNVLAELDTQHLDEEGLPISYAKPTSQQQYITDGDI